MIAIRTLSAEEAPKLVSALAELLIDVVDGGASVSFFAPLARTDAEAFWQDVTGSVQRDERVLLGAFDGDALVGTVQLLLRTPPNQPHRAEVAKFLVLRRARGRGIGRMLLNALEAEARKRHRTLLTLDTVVGSTAEKLYASMGYVRVGEIPGYALSPYGGELVTTRIFYKQL